MDDLPIFYAATIISGGISYNSGTKDALNLITAPMGTVPIGVPEPFSVVALGPDLNPAGGVSVTYTVISGTATLGCGKTSCTVSASGDGMASMNVTAVDKTWSIITASLSNGSSLQAELVGGTAPVLSALTPLQSVAAGATVTWTAEALVLNKGVPVSGQSVVWQSSNGIALESSAAISNGSGIAAKALTVGPLNDDQEVTSKACLNGGNQCVAFTVLGARPEYATVQPVSGTSQSLSEQGTPSQITLRVLDMDGNPMAGGTVTFYQALYAWEPPCTLHTVCVQGALLATQSATATSALDGTVAFAPTSLPGVATKLLGLAATGNSSTVSVAIEQHP